MTKMRSLFLSAFLAVAFLYGCAPQAGNHNAADSSAHKADSTKKDSLAHWEYEGEHGSEHWKDLCTAYTACGGQSQSPINVVGAEKDASLKAIQFAYTETKPAIVHNGHTIQINCDEGSKVTIAGKEYKLLQFHYHANSEHQIEGKYAPLEVHFVNKAEDGNLAVVGVMFKEGKENPLFTSYLKDFPTSKGKIDAQGKIELAKLLPASSAYYTYAGSLTTPPCSEIVTWFVMKTPVEASKDQLDKFAAILKHNFRPVQALNGRKIKMFMN